MKGGCPRRAGLPEDIPVTADRKYRNQGWISGKDWYGFSKVQSLVLILHSDDALGNFSRTLGLRSVSEWNKFRLGELPEKGIPPKDIPAAPQFAYKNKGWINWGDWLGTGTIAPQNRKFQPFEQARSYVQNLGFRDVKQWSKYSKGALPQKALAPKTSLLTPMMFLPKTRAGSPGTTAWHDMP